MRIFPGVVVSALNGDGMDDLMANLERRFRQSAILAVITISPADGAARAWLHQNAIINSSKIDDAGVEQIKVSINPVDRDRFTKRWPDKLVTSI